jgi:hypothetical protein
MTDKKFREWVRRQPSCLSGRFSEYVNGEGRNLACHVRRAATSGISYKPPYSCVPMTDEEHRYQHQHGELACLLRYMNQPISVPQFRTVAFAKEWFVEQAERYRKLWEREQS